MTGSFWEYFLFYRLAGFYVAWLEGVCHLVQELYFASSPRVWHEIHPSVQGDQRPLNWFPYSDFCWRKRCYFRFRVLANHSLTLSEDLFGQLSLPPGWGYEGTDSQTYILYFLQQASWSWPTFLVPLLMVSLWRPVNSNTEG